MNKTPPLANLAAIAPSMDSIKISMEDVTQVKPKIPDGGWGWMVVFSSLILSLIMDGISFSFGILYSEFYDEFGGTSSETSWIGSLFLAVPLLTGPIMSALVDHYGCRAMTIVGGIVSAIGFILATYVKSLLFMYLTFGVIAGLGLGLTYVTAVVSIAFWFDKKRNLAVGLGACGVGIGTFAYAPFTTYLLSQFGWRGTVLILAGTLLNLCVCGALMRDPDWIIEQDKENSKLKSHKSSTASLKSGVSTNKIDLSEIKSLMKEGKDAECILQTLSASVEKETNANCKEIHQSALNLPTYIKENEKVPLEVLEHLRENKRLYNIIIENYPSLLLSRSSSDKGLNKLEDIPVTRVPITTLSFKLRKPTINKPNKMIHHQQSLPEHQSDVNEPLMKRTGLIRQQTSPVSHQHYFRNVRFSCQSMLHRGAILNKHKYRLRASSCPNIYRVSMTTIADIEEDKWTDIAADLFRDMFDFSLFLEFHFFLVSLSTIMLYAWFMIPYFYLADHLDTLFFTKTQASFIISAIGVTNTIGMVALGWAGDQSWVNVPKVYAVCLVLCGMCCSAFIYSGSNYILLTITGALYGVFLASSFSFTPVLLMDLVPLDRFTTAYGLSLLCQGIGHLGGPPIAGWLYDVTTTWLVSFHLSGICIIISGILIAIIPYTTNKKMIGEGPVEKELEKMKTQTIL